MKKCMSLILSGIVLISGLTAFADTVPVEEVQPVLISAPTEEPEPTLYEGNASVPFEIRQQEDVFTIILEENLSTGYAWVYTIQDKAHVAYVSEQSIQPEVEMPGAPGKKEFTFKVQAEGVSTIQFSYERAWESNAHDVLNILVYKRGDKVIVEEDQKVYALDQGSQVVKEAFDIYYNDGQIESVLKAKKINGITMIPLRSVTEAMGYKVTWNGETQSIEILKGAQWTSVKIGDNSYFKNKMAPWQLSAAPVIEDGHTYVPVEFMVDILGKGLQVEMGDLMFNDSEVAIHEGYVHEIAYDETGTMTITLASQKGSDDVMDHTIIHTSKAYTHYNKTVEEGAFIKVISPMIMTMSIPGQTSGYVVY